MKIEQNLSSLSALQNENKDVKNQVNNNKVANFVKGAGYFSLGLLGTVTSFYVLYEGSLHTKRPPCPDLPPNFPNHSFMEACEMEFPTLPFVFESMLVLSTVKAAYTCFLKAMQEFTKSYSNS